MYYCNMNKKHILIIAVFFFTIWLTYCFSFIHNTNYEIWEIKIFDRNNIVITHIPKKDWLQIKINSLDEVSPTFINNLIKIEDKRFFNHFGIDILSKFRAIKSNFLQGQIVSGWSTITEQLIKNLYFKGEKRTVFQKLKEWTLSFYKELTYSKNEILLDYLNNIYLWNNIYWIKTASYVYFEKSDLKSLNEEEIITILSLIKSPSALTSNENYFMKMFKEVNVKLNKNIIVPTNIKFTKFKSINKFPHVTNKILKESDKEIIHSTIDYNLQFKTKEIIKNSLIRLKENNVTNAAVYAFNPKNWEVYIYQWSKDFYDKNIDWQVNIIERKRQVGSTLKPFIYLYAFINWANPNDLILDLEKDFKTEKNKWIFRPLNYNLNEAWVVTLKEALANSLNISAVKLLEHLWLENTYNFLTSLGLEFDFPSYHYGLSLALWSPDLTMKNLAETYGTVANWMNKVKTSLIKNSENNEKWDQLKQKPRTEQLENNTLFEILSSKVYRRKSFWLSSILNTSIPFAVKTWTTKNFRDNWTIWYKDDLVVAVWAGNNNNSSMIDVSWITWAAPIWHRVVELAIKNWFVNLKDSYEWIIDEKSKSNKYCIEDFYIQDIDLAEITKVSKLLWKAVEIQKCKQDPAGHVLWPAGSVPITIIKPKNWEVFYINPKIALELQKIIIKANNKVDWMINDKEYKNIQTIFLLPEENEYKIKIKDGKEIKILIKHPN